MTASASPLAASIRWLARRLPELAGALRPLPAHATSELDRLVGEAIDLGTRSRMETALKYLTSELGMQAATWQKEIDPSELPMAGVQAETGAFIVKQRSPAGGWIVEDMHGSRHMLSLPSNARYVGIGGSDADARGLYKSAGELFRGVLREHRSFFVQAAIASVVINALALMTSLYSMQIYDRVIPTQGLATLYTLTAGVGISIVLELIGKFARASILDQAIRSMDTSLSHSIFERLLRVRMDQFPSSVGTLSGQLRSYEQIRSFASAVTLYLLVDGPFALLFLLVIYLLGGPWVAAVPMAFFVVSLSLGLLYRGAMERHARSGMMASHRKLGLLVESVEGAEAIKSTNSSWKFLSRWNALSRVNIDQDMHLRHLGEAAGYYASFLQQASYVLLIAVGAYVASTSTTLTAGGLIACSILSGRVLTPVGMLPGLMVQWANAKSALTSIAQIFSLEQDNHGVDRPMAIDHIEGELTVRALEFGYRGHDTILRVEALSIRRGEKVGLLGTVGSGKSTLLKLFTGMYMPSQGSIALDGIDLQHLSRAQLADRLGYLPQDVRLFAGTLKDNLMLGVVGRTDKEVLAACELTGLAPIVAAHRQGFDLPIAEGGTGLSGGQRQLLALTRMILSTPDIWLLDEPTASMDEGAEMRTMHALQRSVQPDQTLVLVTHKPSLLQLVDRLIILSPNGVVMDGPKDQVLQQITKVRPISPNAQGPAAAKARLEEVAA